MRWELDGAAGAVLVVDVLRAFTTAAYAFDAGARAIYLVATVDDALRFNEADLLLRPSVSLVSHDEIGRRLDAVPTSG